MTIQRDVAGFRWRVRRLRNPDNLRRHMPWDAWQVGAETTTKRPFPDHLSAVQHADREARHAHVARQVRAV